MIWIWGKGRTKDHPSGHVLENCSILISAMGFPWELPDDSRPNDTEMVLVKLQWPIRAGVLFLFSVRGQRKNSYQPPSHGGKEVKLESCECSNFPDGGSLSTGRGTKLACRGQHGEKAEVPCLSSQVHLLMKPDWTPTLPAASCTTSWSMSQCTPFVYAHLRWVSVLCIQGSFLHNLKRNASWWDWKGSL